MDKKDIQLVSQLNPAQQAQVATIYAQAFKLKFAYLWFFTTDRDKLAQLLQAAIVYEQGYYVLDKTGQVLGLVGLEDATTGYYVQLTYANLRQVYGVLAASWRFLAYKVYRGFHGKVKPDYIHVDPIVVSSQATGQGIGSRLFEQVFAHANQKRLPKIILEVVDTNPQAQKLYKRLGFAVVKTEHFGFFTKPAGFSKVYHMVKTIDK